MTSAAGGAQESRGSPGMDEEGGVVEGEGEGHSKGERR